MIHRVFLNRGFSLSLSLSLTFLILLVVNPPAYSTEVSDLYSVSVKVETQSVRERRIASQDALAEVFIRASGHAAVIQNEDLQLSLSKADHYITSYAYQAVEQSDESGLGDEHGGGFILSLDFDSVQVNKALKSANLPVWGINRPQLLMWWAIEDKKGRRLVNSENEFDSFMLTESHAKRRGIPLSWPLLDLTDKLYISTNEVWALSLDKVLPASERYGAQAVIMGRVRKTGVGRWFGSWALLLNGQQFWLDGDGANLNSVMQQAMNFAAGVLAEQYAVTQLEGDSGGILLKITGVDSLRDYAELNNYLAGLSSVDIFTLKAVDQGNVWYSLKLESDVANFEKVIRLDKRLQKLANEGGLEIDESRLDYHWNGL